MKRLGKDNLDKFLIIDKLKAISIVVLIIYLFLFFSWRADEIRKERAAKTEGTSISSKLDQEKQNEGELNKEKIKKQFGKGITQAEMLDTLIRDIQNLYKGRAITEEQYTESMDTITEIYESVYNKEELANKIEAFNDSIANMPYIYAEAYKLNFDGSDMEQGFTDSITLTLYQIAISKLYLSNVFDYAEFSASDVISKQARHERTHEAYTKYIEYADKLIKEKYGEIPPNEFVQLGMALELN